MARALAVNDTLETSAYLSLGLQVGVNVRHWRISAIAGASLTDLQVAEQLSALVGPLYKAFMDATYTYVGIRAQIITPQRWPAVTTNIEQGVGDLASDPLPSQTAAVVKLQTGLIGRSYRGRMYVPGFTETHNSVSGGITPAGNVLLQALVVVFTTPVTFNVGADSVSLVPVIYSRKLDSSQTVIGSTTHTRWGTMRKRSSINRPDGLPVL